MSSERRRIRADLHPLGFAGIALLRLHALRDPTAARGVIEDMRRMLDAIGDDELLEERTPMVDLMSGYARWATVYDLPGNPLVECEQPAVHAILDRINSDPVLDAACGTGRHLAYLTAQRHATIGVDQSPEMLAKAREKVPDADLRQGDLLNLPLDAGEVAAAVCALALDHVEDLSPAYAELARVTRPNGTVAISTMHPVLRSIVGWGAWFIDEHGKTDVPSYEHSVGDHLNAAAEAGLVLRHCAEPTFPVEEIPQNVSPSLHIAYDGMPMILVLEFVGP